MAIGYVYVGTNDFENASRFYDALFELMGSQRALTYGEKIMWGASWPPTQPLFGLTTPYDGEAATTGNGTMVALSVESRSLVQAVHAKALSLGGVDEGAPGLRGPEGPTAFYGAYFRDLDRNKICIFHIGGSA